MRDKLKLAGFSLLGIAVMLGAARAIVFNIRAREITVRGSISRVFKVPGGKHSYDTAFCVTTPAGETDALILNAEANQIVLGETALVTYQAGSNKLLYIEILDGQFIGYQKSQPTSMPLAVLAFLVGFGVLGYGVLSFFLNSRSAPDGAVDSRSMIDLG